MGTVDIEDKVEELLLSIEAPDNMTYDQFHDKLVEIVSQVTEYHYSLNDGEIDDWDMWEQDIMSKIDHLYQ